MRILLPLFIFLALPAFAERLTGKVVSITDGDTIVLLVDSKQIKIRLAEIDTPERGQPWGNRAKQAISELVFQKTVSVDVSDTDRYGRSIGKVWLDGRDINRELVAGGHAWVYRQYMSDRTLLKDESEAREAGLGLWSLPNPISPWDWRRGARSAPVASGKTDEHCGPKRYCREMVNCEEARFYLQKCGLTRLDGDSDGVPCESICRR
jgi:endonuclease YncB( thermonuclease family)